MWREVGVLESIKDIIQLYSRLTSIFESLLRMKITSVYSVCLGWRYQFGGHQLSPKIKILRFAPDDNVGCNRIFGS